MTDLIHKVADLIDERDREGLEATLARVFFDLSGARALKLWRVFRRREGVWLRARVALPQVEGEVAENEVKLELAPERLRLAFESRNVARSRGGEDEPALYVLPVHGGVETRALIEIETRDELDHDRISLLIGMLRIYRSHLAALDYGDIDELTRLANRRTFDEQFNRTAFADSRRSGARRSGDLWGERAHLGVADIDFFKQVNDRFGHPYGDEVLVLFASLMRDTFRETDRLFRFGGEEFVILMSNCELDDALMAFERFRAAVEAFRFPQVGQVTVSIGVTSLTLHDTGSAAFGRADQALYVAKRSGRNRVLLYEALEDVADRKASQTQASEVELF